MVNICSEYEESDDTLLTLRFPKSISCELLALGINLKYEFTMVIFHFTSTHFYKETQEIRKINILQVHFNDTKLQPLWYNFQEYSRLEMPYYNN